MRRFRFAIIVVAFVAACVPSTETGGAVARTPTPLADARPGGTLRIAVTPPDGIDPTGAHEPAGELIAATMCDQLVAFDPVTGQPVPSLADWTVADGGRNVFFDIRSDARFSDGSPVTPEDIAFTLTRLADERFASPSASLLERVVGYGFVHGDTEADDEALRRHLVGVDIVDGNTVSISVDPANADFFRTLAHPATSPISKRAATRDPAGFAGNPVCAGPYKLAAPHRPGEQVRLTRAETYAGTNPSFTRAGRGYADTIEFHPYRTRAQGLRAFRRGEVDVAALPEGVRAPRGATVAAGDALQTEFIGFPVTKPPFDDARVRIALSLALDRTELARRVYGDARTPASAIVPSPPAGSRTACTRNAPVVADVRRAKALLAQARVDATTLRPALSFNDEFANAALMREVARQWREALGVRATLQPMPWERYRSAATRPQGPDVPFRFSWTPRVPSVEQVLAPLFTVGGIGKDNWTLYSSRDLDDALREAREAADATDRARHETRAIAIVCDELPMLPVVRARRSYAMRGGVGSAIEAGATHAVDGTLLIRELTVG